MSEFLNSVTKYCTLKKNLQGKIFNGKPKKHETIGIVYHYLFNTGNLIQTDKVILSLNLNVRKTKPTKRLLFYCFNICFIFKVFQRDWALLSN